MQNQMKIPFKITITVIYKILYFSSNVNINVEINL